MKRVSDDLIRRLKEGDEDAFDLIVERYRVLLYGIIYKIVFNKTDAEDILVDVFQKLWNNIDNLNLSSKSFHSWIITVAYNESRDFLRKQKNYEELITTNDDIVMSTTYDANGILSTIFISDLKNFMTDEQLSILIYKDIMNMHFVQIAEKLNISERSVRRRYKESRIIVCKYFGRSNDR